MALSAPLLSVTNRTPGSWCVFLATCIRHKSYSRVLVALGLGGSFWPTLVRNKSYSGVLAALSGPLLYLTVRTPRVLVALSGPLLSVVRFWPTLIRFTSYSGVLVALSCPLLCATNRTPGSWWLFAVPLLFVTNRTPGPWWLFQPILIRNKTYSRIFVAPSGPRRNKSYSRVLVALSGPLLSVTNRTPGSWWLLLAHSYS